MAHCKHAFEPFATSFGTTTAPTQHTASAFYTISRICIVGMVGDHPKKLLTITNPPLWMLQNVTLVPS